MFPMIRNPYNLLEEFTIHMELRLKWNVEKLHGPGSLHSCNMSGTWLRALKHWGGSKVPTCLVTLRSFSPASYFHPKLQKLWAAFRIVIQSAFDRKQFIWFLFDTKNPLNRHAAFNFLTSHDYSDLFPFHLLCPFPLMKFKSPSQFLLSYPFWMLWAFQCRSWKRQYLDFHFGCLVHFLLNTYLELSKEKKSSECYILGLS